MKDGHPRVRGGLPGPRDRGVHRHAPPDAAFHGLVIGAMSVGVLLVALVESDASKTRWGQILLLVGSIGEFLTLLTLTAYHLVHQHGYQRRAGGGSLSGASAVRRCPRAARADAARCLVVSTQLSTMGA